MSIPEHLRYAYSDELYDADRLSALYRYNILDTPPEEKFERITELVAHLFDVPIVLVAFIDIDRQWFKSTVGFDEDETSLVVSFCAHTLVSDQVLVVEDAAKDSRFRDNPLVTGKQGIRFYAGAPIITPEGHSLGSLSIIDTTPRSLSDRMARQLQTLAAMVMDELELRQEIAERKAAQRRLRQVTREYETVFNNAQDAIFFYDVRQSNGDTRFELIRTNAAHQALIGLSGEEAPGMTPREYLGEEVGARVEDTFRRCAERQETLMIDGELPGAAGTITVQTKLSPVVVDGKCRQIIGISRDVTEQKALQEALREERALLQRTQEVAEVGGWEYDSKTRTLHGTEEFYRIIGHPVGEAVDLEASLKLYPLEERAVVTEAVERCLSDGTPFDLEVPLVTANGERRMVRVRGEARDEEHCPRRLMGIIQDITDRKQREDALRRNRNLLRNIFETSPAGIIIIDAEGRITRANKQAEEIFKLPEGELTSRTYDDAEWHITAPDGRALPEEELPFALVQQRNEPVLGIEHAITLADGTRRILHVSGAPLHARKDALNAVLVIEDVTAKWEAEQDLRRSRQLLKEAQRIGRIGHWTHDLTQDELRWSDETYRIMGRDPDEPITVDAFIEMIHPADRKKVLEYQIPRMKEGEIDEIRYRIIRPNGEERIVRQRGEGEFDAHGHPISLTGTVWDITDRVAAERRIRLQAAALEASANAIAIFDRNGTFVSVNSAFAKLTGYSEEEVVGRPMEILHAEDKDLTFYEELWETITFGSVWHGELQCQRKDGSHYVEEQTITPVRDEDGEVRHFIAIKQDVTERKRAEEELREAKETAEEMNRLKTAFLANMSHEVRTPLTAIIGFAEELEEMNLAPPADEFVRLIYDSSHRLFQMLASVLDLSLLEAGSMELHATEVIVQDAVSRSLEECEPVAAELGIQVTADVPPAPVEATLDSTALHRILANLVSNAIKFNVEGGEVIVRLSSTENRIVLSVEDTGIGIDSDHRSRIFTAFHQESSGLSREFEGSGLGLTVTKELVYAMGGILTVDSQRGKGSTFTVRLPRWGSED